MNTYVCNHLRSSAEIRTVYTASTASARETVDQRASGANFIQEFSLVDRRAIPPVLSQDRPKAWPQKIKHFLKYIRIRDIITLEHMKGFILYG